ncbi:peptidase family M28-domain-containing protein [Aspergillus floccosus]
MASKVTIVFGLWLHLVRSYKTLSDETLLRLPRPDSDFDIYEGLILAPILRTRVPDTPGSVAVRNHFIEFFRSSLPEWTIELHSFATTTPVSDGRNIRFTNFIAFRDPPGTEEGNTARLTIVAHADSKLRPTGFIGAMDSAAPCAIIMHAARSIDKALTRKWDTEDCSPATSQGVQVIFTDGEERFSDPPVGITDQLYGSKALAADWEKQKYPSTARYPNRLASISLFVLLDLLGASHPVVSSRSNMTHWVYKNLALLESRFRHLSGFQSIQCQTDISAARSWLIDSHKGPDDLQPDNILDDHVPFSDRGVEVLSIIDHHPVRGFPGVWHTLDDDGAHLDMAVVGDWSLLVSAFMAEIRPQGAGFAIWNQQAATIVVLVAGPIALERIAWKFFLVLIAPTALYIPVIYFFFPETKKKSLEDINAQFGEVVAVGFEETQTGVEYREKASRPVRA